MVQLRGGLRLVLEPGEEADIRAVLGTQHLDGHVAAELGVAGAVDGRHATLADQLGKVVSPSQDVAHVSHARAPSSARQGRTSTQVDGREVASELGADVRRSSASSTEALSQPIVVPAS